MAGRRPTRIAATDVVGALLLAAACGEGSAPAPTAPAPAAIGAPSFVGGAACAGCHPAETRRWRGSHHDRAMQEASAETVLGDFSGAGLDHFGESFRFVREGDGFRIEATDGAGRVRSFEVTHTFGVAPLQQYLVPTGGGRLQALGVAWDARPAAEGGQRWLPLREEAVPPGDPLHWTGLAGSWNAQCADCHSTNLAKGYDPGRNTYQTRWSEIDVACEACHGPGSAHAAEPARPMPVDLRDERTWQVAEGAAIAHRVPARTRDTELETCAPCHSRRERIVAGPQPGAAFLDGYRPALLDAGLYHADGQILDEVYVWGSFVQSRMYAAGVSCSDCHDPHALAIDEPDRVCASCHRTEVFAATAHHHHPVDSAGASCVACHMPTRTYMRVDDRRDHGFRVPRPDLSASIGVPNACTGCHADQSASWAAEAAARWYGPGRTARPHFAEALHAGRRRAPGAATDLATLALDSAEPALVRATALALLGGQLDTASLGALQAGLRDTAPLLRMAAAGAAEGLPPRLLGAAVAPLLADPVRAVRIEAARVLAPLAGAGALAGREWEAALAEYRQAQQANADRPEARVNLGVLDRQLGDLAAAEREYRAASALSPFFVPAYVNLADLYREQGREAEALDVLQRGLARIPESADLHHALGLARVRAERLDEAIEALARAARLDPDNARYVYVYGVALHSAGATRRAIAVLSAARARHPGDPRIRSLLQQLEARAGDPS